MKFVRYNKSCTYREILTLNAYIRKEEGRYSKVVME